MRAPRDAVALPMCAVPAVLGVLETDALTLERRADHETDADHETGRTFAGIARELIDQMKTTGAVDLRCDTARSYFFDALQQGASRALAAADWADVRAFAMVAGIAERSATA